MGSRVKGMVGSGLGQIMTWAVARTRIMACAVTGAMSRAMQFSSGMKMAWHGASLVHTQYLSFISAHCLYILLNLEKSVLNCIMWTSDLCLTLPIVPLYCVG